MRYLALVITVLVLVSCTKENDNIIDSETEISFVGNNWNRISMEVNPIVLLSKQDGSGEFHEIADLMDLKQLEGYEKNMEGFYNFKENGTYSFTSISPSEVKEGTYNFESNTIKAINSKGEALNYKVLINTNESLVLELPMIFFGQETTIKISCNSI